MQKVSPSMSSNASEAVQPLLEAVMDDKITFSFGKNWQDFLENLDDERIRIAESSLTEFLGVDDLRGKSFLDIGCGSGLFSLAAFRLHADRIVSFDIDPDSVGCCKYLHRQAGAPDNWEVRQGSILDKEFVGGLGTFDVVYAWGVLHHTGKIWEAIENSMGLVAPGGRLYVALYNKILSRNGSETWIHKFWLKVKNTYNAYPSLGEWVLLPAAKAAYLAMVLMKLENPVKHLKSYRSHRGMNWATDAADWLGGYPYEYATVEEVFKFVKKLRPDFNLVNIKVTSGRGLNWYLFERSP